LWARAGSFELILPPELLAELEAALASAERTDQEVVFDTGGVPAKALD
jgi:hypothetical protein